MFDEKLYDELFAEADAFVKEVNPCKVVNGECLRKYNFLNPKNSMSIFYFSFHLFQMLKTNTTSKMFLILFT